MENGLRIYKEAGSGYMEFNDEKIKVGLGNVKIAQGFRRFAELIENNEPLIRKSKEKLEYIIINNLTSIKEYSDLYDHYDKILKDNLSICDYHNYMNNIKL